MGYLLSLARGPQEESTLSGRGENCPRFTGTSLI